MKNRKVCFAVVTLGMLMSVSGMSSVYAEDQTPSEPPQGETDNPPEKPDGEAPQGETDNPPEKPDGEAPQGETDNPPEKPDGETPQGNPGDGQAPMGGADTQKYDYSGELKGVLSADQENKTTTGETLESTESDVNTVLAENGGTVTIENGILKKTGDDTDGDTCNFYGVNSGVLSVGENSLVTIAGSSLETDSTGSNALFATNQGKIYAFDSTIHTTSDNSRGMDATYSGTVIGEEMTVQTEGDHSASLATDRGGGNISVSNSSLQTAGSGSPLLYSTGVIEVDNVQGAASGSQIAGMEGMNTIRIHNSTLTSTIQEKTASDPVADGVIIYQSMSGDADTASSEKAFFSAEDSTLKSGIESGAMFYVTNTTADIVLSGTTLDFDSSKAALLLVQGNDSNGWGTAGKNGGHVVMTCYSEDISGDITVDSISDAELYLLESSTWEGAFTTTKNSASEETAADNAVVNLEKGSKWIVTGNSTVTSLHVEEGASIVDKDGKTVSIVCDGETVVKGDSSYTVTVENEYDSVLGTNSKAKETMTLGIDRSDFEGAFGLSAEGEVQEEQTQKSSFAGYALYVILPVAAVCALFVRKGKKETH